MYRVTISFEVTGLNVGKVALGTGLEADLSAKPTAPKEYTF